MNKQTKKDIKLIIVNIIDNLDSIKTELEELDLILQDELEKIDNLKDFPQFEEKAYEYEEDYNELKDMHDDTEMAIDDIYSTLTNFDI